MKRYNNKYQKTLILRHFMRFFETIKNVVFPFGSLRSWVQIPSHRVQKKALSYESAFFICFFYYKKTYFNTNRIAKTYIRGVTFFALPVATCRMT